MLYKVKNLKNEKQYKRLLNQEIIKALKSWDYNSLD